MPQEKLVQPLLKSVNAISSTLSEYYINALSFRQVSGAYHDLVNGYIHENRCDDEFIGKETEYVSLSENQGECGCASKDDVNAYCDICKPELINVCDLDEEVKVYESRSPFNRLAELLVSVKEYEYIALIENALANVGNKPFKLKATKDLALSDEDCDEVAAAFFELIETTLDENQITIDEIPSAFNLNSMSDLTDQLESSAKKQTRQRKESSISRVEDALEKIFDRANYMQEYLEVIRDTRNYPIGVLWIDDHAFKHERVLQRGKLDYKRKLQCNVERVDPCMFWATNDFTRHQQGTAVFRLKKFTRGDIQSWVNAKLTGSPQITESLEQFLDTYENGYKEYKAQLFTHQAFINQSMYDVMICRGQFPVDNIKEAGIDIPDMYKDENYIPCEIYFAGEHVLRVRVMKFIDDLGVYTTNFRQRGNSIYGYSLRDFILPFAKFYQSTIDRIDTSSGKSTGSIIQIDTSVIDNPDEVLKKDPKTGELVLDFSEDMVIEFDSAQAILQSPNFKGVPMTVTQLPNDLGKVLPLLDVVFTQLEKITGIPTILVNANNISSALRTTESFNMAFEASGKIIKTLLREGVFNVMKPSIRYIHDAKAASGEFEGILSDTQPEIQLADEVTRQFNDDQQFITALNVMTPYVGIIPRDRIAALINMVGRRAFNLDEDIVPGVDGISVNTASNATESA